MNRNMTKERLIRLFSFDGTNEIHYHYRTSYGKQAYKEDKPLLEELIKEGKVKFLAKDYTRAIYIYINN